MSRGVEPEVIRVPADAPMIVRVPYRIGSPAAVDPGEVKYVNVAVGSKPAMVMLPNGHRVRLIRDKAE